MITTAADRAARTARDRFGVDELRPWQAEAIAAVLDGHDVVLVAPTGGGKSLVYQVAGLETGGWTLVVSPLLALQSDQVAHLAEAHDVTAARLSSAETARQRARTLEATSRCEVDFLFLAPEQLADPAVAESLAQCPPSLVVVDEAHCVSEWGHDFRPDYLQLGRLLTRLDPDAATPVLAMTATAAPPVRESIEARLRMTDPVEVTTDLARENLVLEVRRAPDRARQLAHVVDLVEAREPGTPALVYCRSRAGTEEIAAELTERGVSAAHFHAGLARKRRERTQRAFMADEVDVLVATSAFGMGIDKPDIRLVVHVEVPGSVDAYVQESGRAGRDGSRAEAILVYRPEDLARGKFFASGVPKKGAVAQVLAVVERTGSTDPDVVTPEVNVGRRSVVRILNLVDALDQTPSIAGVRELAEAHQRLERSRVDMVREYAETHRCRAAFLLGYLGERTEDAVCGRCDNCRAGEVADESDDTLTEAHVEHPEFGPGTVTEAHEDRVTVLFADVGYKTLARAVLEDRDMIA
ncbi:RecQ family ATP-dependent DNA helicase [Rhodococcus aerolatus]